MRPGRPSLVRIAMKAAITAVALTSILALAPAASAQIYAMTDAGVFGTLNLTTGAFTQLGDAGITPAGMAGLGGALYAMYYGDCETYLINPANGNISNQGCGSATYYQSGGTTTALYAVGTDQKLYFIDASNGATTLIGPTGLPSGGFQTMSSGGTGLYTTATLDTGTILYSINTTTGLSSIVGNTGVTANVASCGFYHGTLYMVTDTGDLYSVNTSNAQATFIVNTGQDIWGLGIPAVGLSVLHTFNGGVDGGLPFATMNVDASGNLFGTAATGGTGTCSYLGTTGCGTIFELKKHNSSYLFNPLYSFLGGTDGESPLRPMTVGPNGTFYGTTGAGGEGSCSFLSAPECGVVFNAGPNPTPQRNPLLKFHESVLYRFTGGSDGASPFSTVIFDGSGNIYGTTAAGGSHGDGVVFKLTPTGGGNYTESVIYNFAGGSDGVNPYDGLVFDNTGNLYGTTANGGGSNACQFGCGTVFELSPSGGGWTERVLYAFQGGSDGANPNAGVAVDAMGNLYGNTWQAGNTGGGTIYELTPAGGGNYTFHLLLTIPGGAGNAINRVTLDSAGNVYEALQGGGAFGLGQVLKLTRSNSVWIYSDLHDFTGSADGKTAIGGVSLDTSGNVYGTATYGAGTGCGGSGCGVVWAITPQ